VDERRAATRQRTSDERRPEPDGDASFGLFLVESMSDRWGVDVAEGRTRVWFEVGKIAAG
jgi:hypothetical protein